MEPLFENLQADEEIERGSQISSEDEVDDVKDNPAKEQTEKVELKEEPILPNIARNVTEVIQLQN